MSNALPSLPLEKFKEEVFTRIIEIYARTAEVRNPCGTSADPLTTIEFIWVDLANHLWCEFHFGSSLSGHSKLFLRPVQEKDCLYVSFDFEPNTSDDSQPQAVKMRENFHREVQEYLDTLKINEGGSNA